MSAQRERPDTEADNADSAKVTAEEAGAAEEASGDEAIIELQAKADENWDRYLRAAAETENVRKRARRDVEHAHKFALEGFSRELLAVVDSMEIGLQAADSADAAALVEGSEATCKLLKTTMERFGVIEVDPEGEPFDPRLKEQGQTPSHSQFSSKTLNFLEY
jgi:molecular chaperone GrpE